MYVCKQASKYVKMRPLKKCRGRGGGCPQSSSQGLPVVLLLLVVVVELFVISLTPGPVEWSKTVFAAEMEGMDDSHQIWI